MSNPEIVQYSTYMNGSRFTGVHCIGALSHLFVAMALTGFISFVAVIDGYSQNTHASNTKQINGYDFDASQFKSPALEFAPFARWWWPGNDVTPEELKREINVFADNTFGGVEIQPFALNVPLTSEEVRERVYSWDTPSFYENVGVVMEEALKRGLTVDMNNGSGWPPGGYFLDTKDGFINLLHASTQVAGGQSVSIPVPGIANNTEVAPRLIAVLAAKRLSDATNVKTVPLDAASIVLLTSKVKNDSLRWSVPDGDWEIMAFWSRPNSKTGSMTASRRQGPVVNHFDSVKMSKNYEHLFGPRTGLEKYYGKPLRAVFNDSYEFAVDRHFSDDLIAYFREKRGYDVTPWLPANMQRKYNYAHFKKTGTEQPDYSFGPEDRRIRYDYDLTLSELFGTHFIGASSRWLEQRCMLHRTQAYGMKMDMIAAAGRASIPETESMLGSELLIKLMSSGAHLYNRPLLSAEAAVFANLGYMTTPRSVRLAVDKLFAAGVNQVIYHGVPYRYFNESTTSAGWYPFYMVYANFCAHLGEGWRFWKYQKELNEYVSRTQYTLRSGKPCTDVLIYYPFEGIEGLHVGSDLTGVDDMSNPEEIFTKGYLEEEHAGILSRKEREGQPDIYSVLNQLEASGLTWEWVNDESLQCATLDRQNQIDIRGNRYQALLLLDNEVMELPTAKRLNVLSAKGLNIASFGQLPVRQPSFLNWAINDSLTAQHIRETISRSNSKEISTGEDLEDWVNQLKHPVRFNGRYSFLRHIKREMNDGSRIQFIWNKSDEWQSISLTPDEKYKYVYWLDAETGEIVAAGENRNISRILPPYNSIILYAGTKKAVDNVLSPSKPVNYQTEEALTIRNWDIRVDTISLHATPLFDWKSDSLLKYSSETGLYTATFHLKEISSSSVYFLDLGKVCYTAEVKVNGQFAGRRLYEPYCLPVTSLLKVGENTIEISVTPGQLNAFIGEAAHENPLYKAFKGKENHLMPAGLTGPVRILSKHK